MAWDFAFDTTTKDTIPDGKGSIVTTDGAETQIEQQFEHVYGAWWGAPKAGSKRRLLMSIGASPSMLQADAQRALDVLVDAGVITNATALAQEDPEVLGRIKLLTTSRDSRTGRTVKTGAGQ